MSEQPDGINYERLYEYRFRDIQQSDRQSVWDVIAPWVYRAMGSPGVVLDPAAGRCEFINAIDAAERWAVDTHDHVGVVRDAGVKAVFGDILSVDLPEHHFEGVFVSNLLEHFTSQDDIGRFLHKMHSLSASNGSIAVMGPNFKYCMKEYFDCADHTLALTETAVAEHLYAAGFTIDRIVARFIPYSFRSRLPASPKLVERYLAMPMAWKLLGKQFLVIAHAG